MQINYFCQWPFSRLKKGAYAPPYILIKLINEVVNAQCLKIYFSFPYKKRLRRFKIFKRGAFSDCKSVIIVYRVLCGV